MQQLALAYRTCDTHVLNWNGLWSRLWLRNLQIANKAFKLLLLKLDDWCCDITTFSSRILVIEHSLRMGVLLTR